ncbi:MAG TPA: exodeoxyribonuclease VII small subunit [Candidatus Acidoferrum sp.]|nr:exodeoxyribonuclease VII small subunit [Candidatus Acidoferrum sp.]
MSTSTKKKQPLKQQLAELDGLLDWFDAPDFDVDDATAQFAKGIALATDIKNQLTKVENKITVLKQRFDQESGS